MGNDGHRGLLHRFRGKEVLAIEEGECLGDLHEGQGRPRAGPQGNTIDLACGSHQLHNITANRLTHPHPAGCRAQRNNVSDLHARTEIFEWMA